MDVHRAERPQLLEAHRRVRGHEPAVGGDHLRPREPAGGRAKRDGVGQLPAEVEPAEEAESLTQGHAPGLAEPVGQRECGLLAEQHRGALPAAVCAGESRKIRDGAAREACDYAAPGWTSRAVPWVTVRARAGLCALAQVTLARTARNVRGWQIRRWAAVGLALLGVLGCGSEPAGGPTTVTVSGSVLGAEGRILRRQLERFDREHAEIVRVEMRPTPDAADLRHQLYVQWLNARATDPDILQVDAIWTPEFAAAGWILPLDRYAPDTAAFFPVTIAANRWQGELFAMPWFVDVGMLYWRTDLFDAGAHHLGRSWSVRSGASPPTARRATAWSGRVRGTRDW